MLKGKTAVVTGSTSGIGLGMAMAMARQGANIVLNGFGDIEAARAQVAALGVRVGYHGADLSKPDQIEAMMAYAASAFGGVDALVNNAAILLDGSMGVLEITGDCFMQTLATNAVAPLRVVQAFLPLLQKSAFPRIVNVSSGAGQLSDGQLMSWAPAYSASKAALNAITQQLAAALPDFAVNSVCPGWCSTDMGGAQAPRTPEQGADTIAWLAVDAPHSLTGKFFRDRAEIVW